MKIRIPSLKFNKLYVPIFFVFCTLITFSIRGVQEAQANLFNADNWTRMLFLPLAALSLLYYCLKYNLINLQSLAKPVRWLFIYCFFSVLSLLNGNWLSYSLIKLVEYFVVLLCGYYICMIDLSKKDFAIKTYMFMVNFLRFLIITVIVGLILSPSKALYSGENEYSAIREAFFPFILCGWIIPITTTSVGMISAILSFIEIVAISTGKKSIGNLIRLFLFLACTILAQSRMAFLGFILACVIYFLFYYKNNFNKIILFGILTVVIIVGLPIIIDFLLRGQNMEEIQSISGRTIWWHYAWNYFCHSHFFNQLFGNGFAAGEKIVAFHSNNAMNTLDSEYLALLISNGIVGLLCYLAFIVTTFFLLRNVLRKIKRTEITDARLRMIVFQVLGIFIIIFTRTFTVTTLSINTYYLVIAIVSICALNGILNNSMRLMEENDGS